MQQKVHDFFAKELMQSMILKFGEVETDRSVSHEARAIDLVFYPKLDQTEALKPLGLLGRMLSKPCPIEFFRNAVPSEEISNCRDKLRDLRSDLQRRAAQKEQPVISKRDLPFLWILSPTMSDDLKRRRRAETKRNWGPGIYFLPEDDYTAVIAIHELPATIETLWLRLFGKGKVQAQAVKEIMALREGHPYREETIFQLSILRVNLEIRQNKTRDLREVMMNLSPAYEQWFNRVEQGGIAKGEKTGIAKGEKIGIAKGAESSSMSTARKLLSKNMSLEEIAEVTNLTITQVRAIQAEQS